MNNRLFKISILLIIVSVLLLTSCRTDGPEGTDITGLWHGSVYERWSDGWNDNYIVFDIEENGTIVMGDPYDNIIWDEARNQHFTWSCGENYFSISGWAGMYFSEYAYDLDGDSLTLVLIRRNFFNDSYEEIYPGYFMALTRDTDPTHNFSDYLGGFLDPSLSYY
ncbi:MAG TPA: hypothetical protein DCO79_11095 [Spirochaeta sp.]|nr:hypothetical protein [Spirochaeta sp.]